MPDGIVNVSAELQQYNKVFREQFQLPDGEFHYRELKGGICNAPVYVYQLEDGVEKPIGVVKLEAYGHVFANEARFAALESMTAQGFDRNPRIFHNSDDGYLVKLGDHYYSMIEYIAPDAGHKEKLIDLVDMLKLTAKFHQYAKHVPYHEALDQSRYQLHMDRQAVIDDVASFGIGQDFFTSDKFQRVKILYQFFSTPTAKEMFARLPKQFIHGDNHQDNLVYKNGEAYYIDLDPRRWDLRLYDFSSCIRHGSDQVQRDYFELAKQGKLFSTIEENYGELTSDEKRCFHLILAFSYIEFFSWAMSCIKEYMESGLQDRAKFLLTRMVDRVDNVLRMCDEGFIDEASIKDIVSCKKKYDGMLFVGANDTQLNQSEAHFTHSLSS